ncbi:DUF1304 domain-containing protein [Weissella diestrammenae]|uniref:DUF1304 domain-containing protein n=1 Tax=Weissella diestrammenae TaxID=1162633 RepID=A0A7G9T3P2_9LACO|nr:DUF1304 domain-containing protein [Weissella diestrammenae]MCM0582699.1 DUF1304 domain-containing protein [Weissella diestrammenae]QNN74717.1 DUF1304 domain-containing protein [Weissella diestrammenae]
MTTLSYITSFLVAIEFFYIMYLETFATTSKNTGRVFSMKPEALANQNVQMLFKNQGIYNGLLAVGILYGLFFTQTPQMIILPIMIYIVLVGLYGSYSSSDKLIVLKQAGLAIITILLILL